MPKVNYQNQRKVDKAEQKMFRRMRIKITAIATSLIVLVLLASFSVLYFNESYSKMEFVEHELNLAITKVYDTHDATNIKGFSLYGSNNNIKFDNENVMRIRELMQQQDVYQQNKNILLNEELKEELQQANEDLEQQEEEINKTELGISSNFKSESYIPIIVYYVDYSTDSLIPAENQVATLTEESLHEAEKHIKDQNYKFTIDEESGLCYLKRGTAQGDIIAFTDFTNVNTYMDNFLHAFSMLIALVVLIVAIISWCASSIVIRPIRNMWTKQKQFIADASHELKTPVAVINANCSLILDDENISPETRKWTQTTQEEAESMKNLINDMLYLSTSTGMTGTIQEETQDLSKEVMRVAMQFEARAFEYGNTLEYTELEEDLEIKIDQQSLQRVITILIDNACKYSHENTEIILKTYSTKKDILFEISDKGECIPKDAEEAVFDRFFRMDKSRTGNKGYGLGLSMAKEIVEKNHGKIKAHSTDEGITTFTIVFPKILIKK